MAHDIEVSDIVSRPERKEANTAVYGPSAFPLPHGITLPFYAPFRYSPRGNTAIARKSRKLRDLVKRADSATLSLATKIIAGLRDMGTAEDFLGPDFTLIPIPRRLPREPGERSTAPEAICLALCDEGLGGRVWPALRRCHAIAKSAWCGPSSRPDFLEHYWSLELTARNLPTPQLLLVDDFITLGRTLLSAAAVIRNTEPNAELRALALVRTDGLKPDITSLTDPIIGIIRYSGGDAFRSL
jgi:hypothetical protein